MGLRDEVISDVPSIPSEFKKDLPKFGKGQAVVKAPDVEAVEVVGYCLTQCGSDGTTSTPLRLRLYLGGGNR